MNDSRRRNKIRIVCYLISLAALLLYLFLCHYGWGIPCFFNKYFGIQCPSCGATRSFLSLLSLDFASAAAFHPIFAFGIYPIAGFLLLQDFILAIANLFADRERLSLLRFLFGGREQSCPS